MAPHDDISTRAMIVVMKSPLIGRSTATISAATGVKPRTVDNIYARAIKRGFDPNRDPLVMKDSYVADGKSTGRPSKQTAALKEEITAKVRENRYGRKLSCADIAGVLSTISHIEVSSVTIWRTLRKLGFKKTKPTRKPGLTKKIKDERL